MSLKLLSRKSVRALLQRGFSLVSAIFLLVILSALGVFMLSISTMQQTTSTQDMQGSLAYQAAKAGLEWGAYQVMNPENINPPAGGVVRYACAGSPTVLPAFTGSLSRFTVTVACTFADFDEGGNKLRVYQIISTAKLGVVGQTNYIERQLTASINTCRTTVDGPPC